MWVSRSPILEICTIRIDKIRPGCNCSAIKDVTFPVEIVPGKSVTMQMTIRPAGQMTQGYGFTCETNRGLLPISAEIFVIRRIVVHQENFATMLDEGESCEYTLTVREIVKAQQRTQTVSLAHDPKVECSFLSCKVDPGPSPEWNTVEMAYKVRVMEQSLGHHSSVVVVQNKDSLQPIGRSGVSWSRVPFISTIPEKVFLGQRPARLFLRSKDLHVEAVRLVEVPSGTLARITGPREIMLASDENAVDPQSGKLVVETNSQKQPRVEIPIELGAR